MNIKSEINVTPLVDIVLVLLIIFMVVTPLMMAGYDVGIPPAADPGGRPAGRKLIVEQIENDAVLLNTQRIPITELRGKLQALVHATDTVFFTASDDLRYDVAMETMDLIRNSGVRKIAILSRR